MKKYVISTIIVLMVISIGLIIFILINPGHKSDQDFLAGGNDMDEIEIVIPDNTVIMAEEEMRYVDAIAHRGLCTQAPQNTMPAFARALRAGADQIELDVQMTNDGYIVVFHDKSTKSITGLGGTITGRSLDEVRYLDAGHIWGDQYKNTTIPTLLEVLTLVKDSDMKINLELKDIGASKEFVENTVRLVKLKEMEEQVIFSSFRYQYLVWIKELDESLTTELVSEKGNAHDLLTFVKADCYNIKYQNTTKRDIEELHDKNKKVYLWTVDDEESMQAAVDMGADGIVTNYADIFISLRDNIY